MGHKITQVNKNSVAANYHIVAGDTLMTINGKVIYDFIDYEFFMADDFLSLELKDEKGRIRTVKVSKKPEQSMGIEFENSMMSGIRSCCNHCIFCFVDQLPPHMRDTMYIKDDDWRMSFLMGNFVTLTNITEKELNRIIERRVSPLYLSVHTTDPELRQRMLHCKRAGDINDQLKRLYDAGLKFNTQIVLCRGINDGEVLDKTISDLAALRPSTLSIAIVPVGLTKFRDKLSPLTPFDEGSANDVIDMIEKYQDQFMEEGVGAFVYASDEFYMVARRELPAYEAYGDFDQIENGVGMIRKFEQEFYDALAYVPKDCAVGKSYTLATGTSACAWLSGLANIAAERTGATVQTVAVENRFFGNTVTVAGLITGQDLVHKLKTIKLNQQVIIPISMLREGENTFLDDMTVEQVVSEIGVPVVPVEVDGAAFLSAIAQIERSTL